jgi:Zn-dependent protease
MFFTIGELIDLVIMVIFIGYIFSSFIKRTPTEGYDPLTYYKKSSIIEDIKFGIMIAAPAVVLHELAHKFTAMAFGATAILHAPSLMGIPYGWYILVVVMRALNFPLFFFVGGLVEHTALPALPSALVSLAGPLMNLILYLGCQGLVKFRIVKKKHYMMVGIAGKINLFLAGFNMIPLPGFDGFNFFAAIIDWFRIIL